MNFYRIFQIVFVVVDGSISLEDANNCGGTAVLKVIYFIRQLLDIILFVVPILLIVMVMVDFVKNIIAGQESDMKKNLNVVLKRIIMAMMLFLVPTIVNFSISLLSAAGISVAYCFNDFTKEQILAVEEIEEINKGEDSSNSANNIGTDNGNNGITDTEIKSFKLKKSSVVLGHYDKKVNTYTIVVTDKNGKKLNNSNFKFESSNPGIASVSSKGKIKTHFGGEVTIMVTAKNNPDLKKKCKVFVVNSLYTRVKLKKKVKGVSLVTGKTVTLASGTEGIFNGLGRKSSKSSTKINGSLVGNVLKVKNDYIEVDVSDVKPTKYYITDVYSEEVVESFVNHFEFDSDTKYLFWTNQGTQTEYMFKGSKGKWKLYKTFVINTGDSSWIIYGNSSSITGVHFDYIIGEMAYQSGYTYKVIWKRRPDGGRTNPWHEYGTGKRYPASHGCTRFQTKDILYMLENHSKFKGSRLIDF